MMSGKNEALKELLAIHEDALKAAFEKTNKIFKNSDDIGSSLEDAVKTFLKKYLPQGFLVGKGEIIDNQQNQSPQVDCTICFPYHPALFPPSERGLFLAEGVAIAIENKSSLDGQNLSHALHQVQYTKKLTRSRFAGAPPNETPFQKMFAEKIMSVIVAKDSVKAVKLTQALKFVNKDIPPEEQFDALFVLNQGIAVYNIKDASDPCSVRMMRSAGQSDMLFTGMIVLKIPNIYTAFFAHILFRLYQMYPPFVPVLLKYFDNVSGRIINPSDLVCRDAKSWEKLEFTYVEAATPVDVTFPKNVNIHLHGGCWSQHKNTVFVVPVDAAEENEGVTK